MRKGSSSGSFRLNRIREYTHRVILLVHHWYYEEYSLFFFNKFYVGVKMFPGCTILTYIVPTGSKNFELVWPRAIHGDCRIGVKNETVIV